METYLRSTDPAPLDARQFEGEPWWDDAAAVETFYEHGQWWLTATFDDDDQPQRTWSVVDVSMMDGSDYLSLEEIG